MQRVKLTTDVAKKSRQVLYIYNLTYKLNLQNVENTTENKIY